MSVRASGVAEALGRPETPRPRSLPQPDRLTLNGVSKSWGPRRILDSVDFALAPGMLAALVGANGVGKTTLLRIVAGLISADRGSVTLDGLDVGADRRQYQRRLGFVSAGQAGLYARLSVQGHLEYWSRIAFVPRSERREAVDRSVERFALAELAAQRVDRLSMGQRQRVRLAMAFLNEPSVVLLDEPRTSLDPAGLDVLHGALTELVSRGGSAIWCAPTADDVVLPAAHVSELREGRLVTA